MPRLRVTLLFAAALAMSGLRPAAAQEERDLCLRGVASSVVAVACEQALEQAPEDRGLVLALVDSLEKRKDFARAVAVLEAFLARHPDDEGIAHRLAVARSNREEQQWLAERRKLARANTPDVALRIATVRCTRLEGEKALAACERALAVRPDDLALLQARARVLLGLQREEEARAALSEVLRLDPDNTEARQALEALGPPPQPTQVAGNQAAPDLATQLAMLKDLREKGLITQRDYEARKQMVLDAHFGATRGLETADQAAEPQEALPDIEFGRYFALVIGNNAYQHLPALETARSDAEGVARVLRERYGFEVTLLLDATRAEIIEALDEFRETLRETDNLLIYYAGHGWLDKEADQGYWLPVDARADRRTNWISNDTVRDTARALKAKHFLVIADSCFSGTLTRSIVQPGTPDRDADYLRRIALKRARLALSSGGLEPVADAAGGNHSPFAKALMDILRENDGILDGATLFGRLRRPVMVNADQTPEYSDIRRAGHEGGDFLFVPARSRG